MQAPITVRSTHCLVAACGLAGAAVGMLLASGPVSQRLAVWYWQSQVNQASDDGVELPLRQLARCGREGLQRVVAVLDSPREQRATAAERALLGQLRDGEQFSSVQASAERLLLAQLLANAIHEFDREGQLAAIGLAEKLLATTRRDKGEVRTALVAACEQVLRQARELALRSPEKISQPTADEIARKPHQLNVDPIALSGATTSLAGGSVPITPAAGLPLGAVDTTSEDQDETKTQSRAAPQIAPAFLPTAKEPTPLPQPPGPALNLPAATQTAGAVEDSSVATASLIPSEQCAETTAASTSPRMGILDAIADLRSNDPQRVTAAEQKLKRRGMSPLELELARRLTDPEVQARERLAYALPSLPGIDARPWLAWLSEDPNPQVRNAAYTVMATVPDPELLERIATAAQSDTDPSIRKLASDLLHRRSR